MGGSAAARHAGTLSLLAAVGAGLMVAAAVLGARARADGAAADGRAAAAAEAAAAWEAAGAAAAAVWASSAPVAAAELLGATATVSVSAGGTSLAGALRLSGVSGAQSAAEEWTLAYRGGRYAVAQRRCAAAPGACVPGGSGGRWRCYSQLSVLSEVALVEGGGGVRLGCAAYGDAALVHANDHSSRVARQKAMRACEAAPLEGVIDVAVVVRAPDDPAAVEAELAGCDGRGVAGDKEDAATLRAYAKDLWIAGGVFLGLMVCATGCLHTAGLGRGSKDDEERKGAALDGEPNLVAAESL